MSWFRDLRYGARSLLKSPGLMIVATLALGFGIGLTATMWSIIYGAMIKGLPYHDPQSIVAVFRTNPSRDIDRMGVTVHDFVDLQKEQKSFVQLGAFTCGTFNVSGQEYQITYQANFEDAPSFTGGNDVALMAVPEPAAALLGGLGMLGLLRRRRVA